MTLPSAKAVIYTELRLKGFGPCQNILFLTAGRSPLPKGIGGEIRCDPKQISYYHIIKNWRN